MKTRERFDEIRAEKKRLFTLRTRMIFAVELELLICIALSLLIHAVLNGVLHLRVPLWIELLIVSAIVGTLITLMVTRSFFGPIKKLRQAMEQVADGDLSVKLEPDESSTAEIREIYAGFNLMTDELQATEILQSDFVSNVSHEIKTPLAAIEGYATLLQDIDALTSEERQTYIEKIMYNTERLSALVGNILLLSRIDSQSIQRGQTTFRLDEQVRQAIMLLESEWVRKDIELDVEMAEISITDSESLLHHVWYNLIGNAVKFAPEGGEVRIRLTREEGETVFSVEDNGPGIDEAARKHIFEKFYQGDSSHKSEGNGLGLALVKRILDFVGGTVTAENLDAGGCRFTVRLRK